MCEKRPPIDAEILGQEIRIEKTEIFSLFDFCMFILIILPASVIFTSSTWDCSDQIENGFFKIYPIIGVTFYLILNLTQQLSYDMARHFLKSKIGFCIFSKVYIYIFATCSVIQWYYVWESANTFRIFNDFSFVIYSTTTFSVVLFICKRLVNLIGGHSVAVEDTSLEDVFLFPTMFETEVSLSLF